MNSLVTPSFETVILPKYTTKKRKLHKSKTMSLCSFNARLAYRVFLGFLGRKCSKPFLKIILVRLWP